MKRFLSFLAAAAIVAPSFFLVRPAQAAGAGDLIQCPDFSSVYYLAEDGKRYVFPNEGIYYSWYPDFSDVATVSCEDLASFPLGDRIQYQAGTSLVKIPSVPTVYAVESDGVLRPIPSEDAAKDLYGDDWADRVDDLPETFFGGYEIGEELADGELPEGMILDDEDGTLLRVDDDGEAQEIEVVLDTDQEDVFQENAIPMAALEARIGALVTRIETLATEGERLTELLAKLSLVQVDLDDEVEIDEVDEVESGRDAQEHALDAIDDAKEEIADAEEDIADDKADGDDVTEAEASLAAAKTTLVSAETAYAAVDFATAETLADDARKEAMRARGKAVDAIEPEDEDETEDETESEDLADEEDADAEDSEGVSDDEGDVSDSSDDNEGVSDDETDSEDESDDSEDDSEDDGGSSGSGSDDESDD